MKNLLILSTFLSSLVQGATIHTAIYNPSTDSIDLEITYGGCALDTFKASAGPCAESFPMQTTLTIDDSKDVCRGLIPATLSFKINEVGLASCRPARVFVTNKQSQGKAGVSVSIPEGTKPVSKIKCERDMRPVDGVYEALELVKNESGKFDAYFTLITPGFGSPVEETRVVIAKNLACQFSSANPLITACLKSSQEEGEKTNSGLNLNFVEETSFYGTTSNYVATIYSPQLVENHEKKGYPHSEYPGRGVLSFAAKKTNSFMLNRCQAN